MRRIIRRGWPRALTGLLLASLIFSWPGVSLAPVLAAPSVVSGKVQTTSGTPVANVSVELHTANASEAYTTTTNNGGNYDFSQSLTVGTDYTVEIRPPTGYNRVGGSYNFTYNGTAQNNVNFQLTAATKTIKGTVTDAAGNKVIDADINIDPYNMPTTSRVAGRTDSSGSYSANVVGGTWFAQAVVNLSEYTPRWIAEQPPVRVDFKNDSSTEEQTINFVVTPASGRVTMTLLNSDGSFLTTSNFNADVVIRRADGVGTIRKVKQADSSLSVYLTPGIYTISAFHRDLQGKSFNPSDSTFVVTDGADINIGTIRAEVDSAHLKGKVVNGSGRAVTDARLEAIREGGAERRTGNTQGDGTFDLTVGAGHWTIGVLNFNDGGDKRANQYAQSAPVETTVQNGETASGLNITVKSIDRTVSGNIVNTSGATLTDYVGTAFVLSTNKKAKAVAPVVDGTFTITYSSADVAGSSIFVGVEAGGGSAYTGSSLAKATISGSSATKNVTVKPYDATISGTLSLSTGAAWSNLGSDVDVEAVDADGNYANTTVGADGTYSLAVAAGTWQVDYNVVDPDKTDGLLNRPAGQNKVTIGSGQTKTLNLTVLKGTNTISGTITDSDGNAVKSAVVNVDNRPSLENSGTASADNIVNATAMTDGSGAYTVKVPNGTYMVTVGLTPDITSTEIAPDGKSVTVSGGSTATANLKFEKSDATIKGKVMTNGKADGGGTAIAYSDDGGKASAEIGADGSYTLNVTSGENWHVEAVDLSGKKLMESITTDLKTKAGANTINLALKDSGVSVPGPVSASCQADDPCAVSLPDGTSVTVPAFGIALSGNVTLTATPVIDPDKTTTDAPATLAYEFKASYVEPSTNSTLEAGQLLKAAEITIPYNQSELEKNGLIESRLTPTYFDPQTQTWEESGVSGILDKSDNVMTMKVDHFTKFSVTGTAKPVPKVTGVRLQSGNATKAVVAVSGKNFKGKVTAKLGKNKATKVQVQNSKNLVITFPTRGIKAGKVTMTITNGNGRVVSVTKTLTITRTGATLK